MLQAEQYEDAYYSHAPAAYIWQEGYSDNDEDDALMCLLRMMRKMVRDHG